MMPATEEALRLRISGTVQGVGFRPFVYQKATYASLKGSVRNTPEGVEIIVRGRRDAMMWFRNEMHKGPPLPAQVTSLEMEEIEPELVLGDTFEIIHSTARNGQAHPVVPADLALCKECREEMMTPSNPRFLYPFINCTHCGPRYSIIETLPYDRANTTMRDFQMSELSAKEYADPQDRRFHAEPNADPESGPKVFLTDNKGELVDEGNKALHKAVAALNRGEILGVKGLGGFHLMCRAEDDMAVGRLRERKHRESKPLAVMFPWLAMVKQHCEVSKPEALLLSSPQAPIVLLKKLREETWPKVAEGPRLGVVLPYTPLHLMLMSMVGVPLVATSGNISDEPICIDNDEAVQRLGSIADMLLMHDRRIVRPVDDSVAQVVDDRPMMLRRSRGYAPTPFNLGKAIPRTLCTGAHMKNTIAVTVGSQIVVSQHVGDLETERSQQVFEETSRMLGSLFGEGESWEQIVCDAHPDYVSTRFAEAQGLPMLRVQHHEAHVFGCLAENGLLGERVLAFAWDGTGYGEDGSIWGGETFLSEAGQLTRVASLRQFPLIGGDAAVRECVRPALGMLYHLMSREEMTGGGWLKRLHLTEETTTLLLTSLEKGINSVPTSSMGRLFDAVSALTGCCLHSRHEGEAAMKLEFAIGDDACDKSYPMEYRCDGELAMLDWEPLLRGLLKDIADGVAASTLSIRFHNTLVEAVLESVRMHEASHVCLTGGCFQNRFLLEKLIERLRANDVKVFWNEQYPTSDGGIAFGQAVAASLQASQD